MRLGKSHLCKKIFSTRSFYTLLAKLICESWLAFFSWMRMFKKKKKMFNEWHGALQTYGVTDRALIEWDLEQN